VHRPDFLEFLHLRAPRILVGCAGDDAMTLSLIVSGMGSGGLHTSEPSDFFVGMRPMLRAASLSTSFLSSVALL
jgi:hypothetical protein